MRSAVDHEHATEFKFVSTMGRAGEMERSHDARLASLFSETEIMVLRFYQNGRLPERRDQALMDMFKHADFRLEDMQSATIVHLIWRLDLPFKQLRGHV